MGSACSSPQCNATAAQPTGGGELLGDATPGSLAQPVRYHAPGLAVHPGLGRVGGLPAEWLELELACKLGGLALALSNEATLQLGYH